MSVCVAACLCGCVCMCGYIRKYMCLVYVTQTQFEMFLVVVVAQILPLFELFCPFCAMCVICVYVCACVLFITYKFDSHCVCCLDCLGKNVHVRNKLLNEIADEMQMTVETVCVVLMCVVYVLMSCVCVCVCSGE